MISSGRNIFKLLSFSNKNCNNVFGGAKMMYTFTSFPSQAQMRSQKQMGYTGFQPNTIFRDDLYYPMENEVQKQALDDDFTQTDIVLPFFSSCSPYYLFERMSEMLINHIKTHPNLTIEGRGLCTILYLIAKNDRHEPFIFRELERHLYKFKENLSARLSFGGLYASYKSNTASAYQVSFFEDEFNRNQNSTSAYDAIEVLKSMYTNTTKASQHKIDYFHQSVKPVIMAKFDKQVRPYNQNLYNLFVGLRDMKIYDEELFELVLKYLPYRKGQTNVNHVADVYETLCDFKEQGVLKQNIDGHIDALFKRLTTREDFKWRYNIKEKRMYTYDELVANRENYQIKDQMLHKYRFSNPELIEKFNLVQSDKDAIKAELEARERSRELENLVLEMFDLKNRGEVKQSEDKNTLMGSYENIIFVKEGEEIEEDDFEETGEVDDTIEEEVDDGVDFSLKSDKPKIKNNDKGGKKNKSHKPQ